MDNIYTVLCYLYGYNDNSSIRKFFKSSYKGAFKSSYRFSVITANLIGYCYVRHKPIRSLIPYFIPYYIYESIGIAFNIYNIVKSNKLLNSTDKKDKIISIKYNDYGLLITYIMGLLCLYDII